MKKQRFVKFSYVSESHRTSRKSTSLYYNFSFRARGSCMSSFLTSVSVLSSSPDRDSGLSASPPAQSGSLMVGRGESGSLGSPPQRLGRQSVQQAEPAPTRLGVPRRTLRRLPVQQQLQHGLRVLVVPAVPLQHPSVRFPTDAA